MSAPGPLATIWMVARREFVERTRARSFRAGTAVIALVVGVLALLPSVLPALGDEEWTVGVAGSPPAGLEQTVDAAAGAATVTLRPAPAGDPTAIVEGDAFDAVVVGDRRIVVDAGASGADELAAVLSSSVSRQRLRAALDRLGAEPEAVRRATEGVEVGRVGQSEDEEAERAFVTFAGVLALFLAIAVYGSWVLNSVLEEKANRVVEIIVSTVDPRRLLAGKVLGNGAAGLLQLLVVGTVALAAGAASGSLPDLPVSGVATVVSVIGWFVLGFAFYAVGYAAAGSLVSRQEDAQSAVTPMMSIVLAAYFAVAFVINPDPAGTAAAVLSLVPPITPLAMPVLIAAGEAAVWQVAVGVVLMLAATWAMVVLAAHIYTNAILRTGARVPLRQALGR